MWEARFNGALIAASNQTQLVEGNQYFPPESVNREYLVASDYHTTCPWKGLASYYHVQVQGKTAKNAAWFYPEPKEKAASLKDYVAFWQGVQVTEQA